MYSSAAGSFAAGHESAGMTAPPQQWFFAEGATGIVLRSRSCCGQSERTRADVSATYLLPDGQLVHALPAPANRRQDDQRRSRGARGLRETVSVSAAVDRGVPIVVERAMCWPHGPRGPRRTIPPARRSPARSGRLADGERGRVFEYAQTYVLLANTVDARRHRAGHAAVRGRRAAERRSSPWRHAARYTIPVFSSDLPFTDANGPVTPDVQRDCREHRRVARADRGRAGDGTGPPTARRLGGGVESPRDEAAVIVAAGRLDRRRLAS